MKIAWTDGCAYPVARSPCVPSYVPKSTTTGFRWLHLWSQLGDQCRLYKSQVVQALATVLLHREVRGHYPQTVT